MKYVYIIVSILDAVGIFGYIQHLIYDIKNNNEKMGIKLLLIVADTCFVTMGCLILYLVINIVIKLW